MKAVSLRSHVRENKVIRQLESKSMILSPFVFLLTIFLFDRYVATISLIIENVIVYVAVFCLCLIILKAITLERYLREIESLTEPEMKILLALKEKEIPVWQSHKNRLKYIEMIPLFLLVSISVISLSQSVRFLTNYFREVSVFIIIVYILVLGLIRLKLFGSYMNSLINIYFTQLKLSYRKRNEPRFMKYNLRRLVWSSAISEFLLFLIFRYAILTHSNLLHLHLFIFAFLILVVLGLGLRDAYLGFFESLEEVDALRRRAGLLDAD